MPLFGKKIFSTVKPLTDVEASETIYTIPHTKEQFKSKEYPLKTITCEKIQHGRAHGIHSVIFFISAQFKSLST